MCNCDECTGGTMVTMKPASELQAGDVFSTDGYMVTSIGHLVDGRVSVEITGQEENKGHSKYALLAPDFPCPIWEPDN